MVDQNRFFRALFSGRLLSRRTLRAMTTPTRQSGDRYGMGITRERTPAGVCLGHSGFWGAVSLYCPGRRLAVSVTVNAASPAEPAEVAAALLATAVGR